MIISVNNRGRNETPRSSYHFYDVPNENDRSEFSSTAALFLNALLSKTGFLVIISLLLGKEAGRSTGSFCLAVAVVSFLGGSRHTQEETPLFVLVFLGGFYVGYNKATVVTVLLSWLVAYVCMLPVKDVAVMSLAYCFGIMANISNHVLFLVAFSYLGGKTVQYDQGMVLYLGLSILVASMGKMNEVFPLQRV